MNRISKVINKTIINRSIINYSNNLFKQNFTSKSIVNNNLLKSITINNNNNNIINNKLIINKKYYTTSNDNDNNSYLNKIKQSTQLVASFKLDESIELLNEVIEMEPNNPIGYINRGKVLVIQKKNDEAIKDFEKVLELTKPASQNNTTEQNDEQRDQAYHYLAMIQREKGNLEGAVKILDKSLDGDHISLDNIILKAELFHKMGNYLNAAGTFALALSSIDKENKEISAQFLRYKLAENIIVCSCAVLQKLPEVDLSKHLEQLSKEDVEFIQSRSESFNVLFEKCNKLMDLVNKATQNSTKGSTEKDALDLLKSIFMAMSSGSYEAIQVMTNPVYQKPQMHHPSIMIDDFLFELYEELIPKFFKL